jgi:pimeloyl-ACP methyl ester carboxylesterase
VRADASVLSCPVLVVWGRRDPVLPWRVDGRRARRSLRAADIVTFACGHQPFAEVPDEFVVAVESFLGRLPAKEVAR